MEKKEKYKNLPISVHSKSEVPTGHPVNMTCCVLSFFAPLSTETTVNIKSIVGHKMLFSVAIRAFSSLTILLRMHFRVDYRIDYRIDYRL